METEQTSKNEQAMAFDTPVSRSNFILFLKRGIGIICLLIIIGLFLIMFINGWKEKDGFIMALTFIGTFGIIGNLMMWGFSK